MLILQKISSEHIRSEDRVRFRGEISPGNSVTLWLMRPLCDLFLPHITKFLEKPVEVKKEPETRSAPIKQIVQQFAQEKAVLQLKPERPVQAQPNNSSWLVQAVDIGMTAGHVNLVLKPGAQDVVEHERVTFNADQLRQWLHILHEKYKNAGWSMNCWQQWIDVKLANSVPSGKPITHEFFSM